QLVLFLLRKIRGVESRQRAIQVAQGGVEQGSYGDLARRKSRPDRRRRGRREFSWSQLRKLLRDRKCGIRQARQYRWERRQQGPSLGKSGTSLLRSPPFSTRWNRH